MAPLALAKKTITSKYSRETQSVYSNSKVPEKSIIFHTDNKDI